MVVVTGVPGENHRPVASRWQTLSHTLSCYNLIQIWHIQLQNRYNLYKIEDSIIKNNYIDIHMPIIDATYFDVVFMNICNELVLREN
jgi:hypothetical protein